MAQPGIRICADPIHLRVTARADGDELQIRGGAEALLELAHALTFADIERIYLLPTPAGGLSPADPSYAGDASACVTTLRITPTEGPLRVTVAGHVAVLAAAPAHLFTLANALRQLASAENAGRHFQFGHFAGIGWIDDATAPLVLIHEG